MSAAGNRLGAIDIVTNKEKIQTRVISSPSFPGWFGETHSSDQGSINLRPPISDCKHHQAKDRRPIEDTSTINPTLPRNSRGILCDRFSASEQKTGQHALKAVKKRAGRPTQRRSIMGLRRSNSKQLEFCGEPPKKDNDKLTDIRMT
jgi:hypothetical protein